MDLTVPVVRGRSHKQIEEEALGFLTLVAPECLDKPLAMPALEIFENKMDEYFGYSVQIGKNIKGLSGVTNVTSRTLVLTSAIHKRLENNDPYARFTAAHEFGHVVLHSNVASGEFAFREEIVFARRSQLKPYEDPEWQANAFAGAILMPINTMRMLFNNNAMTVENVMEIYQVSKMAAEIRIKRLIAEFKK